MDDFTSLSNRLLSRAPQVGIALSQQLINDSWRTLQARREWSFRRRSGIFAPPDIYQTGTVSSNVLTGNPNILTGTGTNWDPSMIGRQIRASGLLYPFYTITGWLSPTSIVIDQPWAGPDISGASYCILGVYFPVPSDFGYFYVAVSIKDSYRLWTNVTESELAIFDPQRTNQGQTYAVVFRDYTSVPGGIISPAVNVTTPSGPSPISTTSTGYSYPANASYVVQVVTGGISGTATFQWLRAGQASFQPAQLTSNQATDLADGVQIYWPDTLSYNSGDIFIIQCQALSTQSIPRYELWPAPTFSGYLYPFIYIAKETDLTPQAPSLPPFMANRGEVILELALAKCATYPGSDPNHPNIYYNLKQAAYHEGRAADMIIDLERNDEEVGVTLVDYQEWPLAMAPWMTGSWMQSHAPWLG